MDLIRGLLATHPGWNRTRLSRELCARWNWRNALGRPKDMAAPTLLLTRERGGHLRLPARRGSPPNARRNRRVAPVRPPAPPMRVPLREWLPLRVSVVAPGSDDAPLFHGLWSYGDLHFSRYGTLLRTAEARGTQSVAGDQVPELEAVVHVAAKDALRPLVQAERLSRRAWEGRSLYGAWDRTRRQEPWAARQAQQEKSDGRQAAKALFDSGLDKQPRRLYAGLESRQYASAGQASPARRLGLDVDAVARGERELRRGQVLRGRVRHKGGGRRAVEKNARNFEPPPGVVARGHGGRSAGPAGCWDGQTVTGHQPGTGPPGPAGWSEHRPAFVGRSRYALPANRKSLSAHPSPFRDQQFLGLHQQRPAFTQSG